MRRIFQKMERSWRVEFRDDFGGMGYRRRDFGKNK